MSRYFSFLVLTFLFLPTLLIAEDFDSIYKQALDQNLDKEREWLLANQYWKNIAGQRVSRIDEDSYFNSKIGQFDSRLELKALLRGLLSEKSQELQCKYPARYRVVNKFLHLEDKSLVKRAHCERYENWKKALDPKAVTLVFPSAYLNNPASMYGHTLLRLDSAQGISNPLLSYGVSFGAGTGEDGGVAFALKGLLGGYRASFTVEPYYDVVKRYGDIEHRDIWEYPLNFTSEEIERLLDFIWEVGETYVDYFFFDENCSLYLLAALDYAKPSIHLLDQFGYYVIPSDTLKAVVNSKDLLKESPNYRPSLTSRLESKGEELSSDEISLGKNLALGVNSKDIDTVTVGENGKNILEFSYDYLEYLNVKNKVTSAEASNRGLELLALRSKLNTDIESNVEEDKILVPPSVSHPSSRFSTGLGIRENKSFYELRVHPAYHDFLDSPKGFSKGLGIQFLDMRFRQYEQDNLELNSITPVQIESYTPLGRVFSPMSWDLRVALDRQLTNSDTINHNIQGNLVASMQGGVGVTKAFGDFIFTGLIDARYSVSPSYLNEKSALGAGPRMLVQYHATEQLRFLLNTEYIRNEIGAVHTLAKFNFGTQYDLSNRFSIRTSINREASFDRYFTEGLVEGLLYF